MKTKNVSSKQAQAELIEAILSERELVQARKITEGKSPPMSVESAQKLRALFLKAGIAESDMPKLEIVPTHSSPK